VHACMVQGCTVQRCTLGGVEVHSSSRAQAEGPEREEGDKESRGERCKSLAVPPLPRGRPSGRGAMVHPPFVPRAIHTRNLTGIQLRSGN